MSVTENFLKLRSSGSPRQGEWNVNYQQALALAKQNGQFIVTCWSNGELCAACKKSEACMVQQVFVDWMKTTGAYFAFQYSGDPDKGAALHDWIYNKTRLSLYPGFRITLYDKSAPNRIVFDRAIDGDSLRGNMSNVAGAKVMIEKLNAMFALRGKKAANSSAKAEPYKIRLNEKLTTKQVNKVLDAIDANEGYCPCQPKSVGDETKCHCVNFLQYKKIGEPCICKIYVKKARSASPKRKRR